MRVKIFEYDATDFGWENDGRGNPDFYRSENAEKTLNKFCETHNVIDIKVNTYISHRHNNGGVDLVKIIYTVLYK